MGLICKGLRDYSLKMAWGMMRIVKDADLFRKV